MLRLLVVHVAPKRVEKRHDIELALAPHDAALPSPSQNHGALGDLGIVLGESSQRQQLASVTGLHGAIAELDDREPLPGEQPCFFGVRDQEEQ
ncbi:MAG: hypothetical protein RJA70_1275 [Pseudomonadota bacterium]